MSDIRVRVRPCEGYPGWCVVQIQCNHEVQCYGQMDVEESRVKRVVAALKFAHSKGAK